MHIASFVLALWLAVGVLAAGQRGEYTHRVRDCDTTATVGVTILGGPLNYMGLNPKINCHHLPQPSH